MTDKVKDLAPKILAAVKQANSILLHCHPSPDPDSVGSALAMMDVLKGMGKKVTVLAGDSAKPDWASILPGADQIVDKGYFDIDPKDYDLFIIQDSSSPDLISKKGQVVFPENLVTVVIDHHVSNSEYGQINLVDSGYIAVCEILFDLFRAWEVELTVEAARCLFLGVYSDSGGFKYPPTNYYTFKIAAELARLNPNFADDLFKFENSNVAQRVYAEGLALSNIKTYFGGQMAVSAVSYQQYREKGIERQYTSKLDVANKLKSVVGWEVAAAMREVEPGLVDVDFRTRDSEKYDVSKLAVALGGGGHKAAAGASIDKPLEEAREQLLETIQRVYPTLRQP